MADGAFLPLDTTIKAAYLDPSAQVQPVFNAGKVNGEQVVLPLLYRVNTYLLDKAQMQDPNAQYTSFDALKTCKDDTVWVFAGASGELICGAQQDVETASEFSVPTAEMLQTPKFHLPAAHGTKMALPITHRTKTIPTR